MLLFQVMLNTCANFDCCISCHGALTTVFATTVSFSMSTNVHKGGFKVPLVNDSGGKVSYTPLNGGESPVAKILIL